MSFEMRFHHRDHLKKPASSVSPAKPQTNQGSTAEKPVYLPLKELELQTRQEKKKAANAPKQDCPLPPSGSRYGTPTAYLTPSESDTFKFNQHATSEKDQKLLAQAKRRHKIISNVLGLGVPMLVSCLTGNKKDGHEVATPNRPVKR